jgi:hypothetical protein
MVTGLKQKLVKSIKVKHCDDAATSWGGASLAERLGLRLGLWRRLDQSLPERNGRYDWLTVIKSGVYGLLTGARGTYAAEAVRGDDSLQRLVSVSGAPEEATFWRCLAGLGSVRLGESLAQAQFDWTRRILERARRSDLLYEGFFPLFGDGTILEGSRRREGTKFPKDKKPGLLWTTLFAGPLVACQELAPKGRGEQSALRSMFAETMEKVVEPLGFAGRALALLDSLHGDGPTLKELERLDLLYVVGANKLAQSAAILATHPEEVWQSTGPRKSLGWSDSAVCTAWIQCQGWETKRLLVGRRWVRQGEFIHNYSGVLTNLSEADVGAIMRKRGKSFAEVIWALYDHKSGCETYYKDLLEDLGLHHPPCQEHRRNAGFYALGALAHTLGRGVDLIGGRCAERAQHARKDGAPRKRPKPRRMRLWRLRRELFALPARILRRARTATVQLLGLSDAVREKFDIYWSNICRC